MASVVTFNSAKSSRRHREASKTHRVQQERCSNLNISSSTLSAPLIKDELFAYGEVTNHELYPLPGGITEEEDSLTSDSLVMSEGVSLSVDETATGNADGACHSSGDNTCSIGREGSRSNVSQSKTVQNGEDTAVGSTHAQSTSKKNSLPNGVDASFPQKRPDSKHGRLLFSKRLSNDIELSRELLLMDSEHPSGSAATYANNTANEHTGAPLAAVPCHSASRSANSTHALALTPPSKEDPVKRLEFSGIRCCPLLQHYRNVPNSNTLSDDDVNLSPFKLWVFKPFLQPRRNSHYKSRHTLVLDLDETLVHTSVDFMSDADAVIRIDVPSTPTPEEKQQSSSCKTRCSQSESKPATELTYVLYIKYRPHLSEFINFTLEHFEVVIFTASKQFYATAVLRQLQKDFNFWVAAPDAPLPKDPQQSRRTVTLLHRDHCTPTNAGFVKDLFLLGRDLRTTVLVDNKASCASFQPINLIQVKDFARRPQTSTKVDGKLLCKDDMSGSLSDMPVANTSNDMSWKLRQLKDAVDSTDLGILSYRSTYLWEDPGDVVLRTLAGPNCLLRSLAKCKDIPLSLMRMWHNIHRPGKSLALASLSV